MEWYAAPHGEPIPGALQIIGRNSSFLAYFIEVFWRFVWHKNVVAKNGDLEIKNLKFVYPPPKKLEIFNGINLSVKEGEFVAIIGHNGSGKTTLSKLISGYLKPNIWLNYHRRGGSR